MVSIINHSKSWAEHRFSYVSEITTMSGVLDVYVATGFAHYFGALFIYACALLLVENALPEQPRAPAERNATLKDSPSERKLTIGLDK